ncbi:RNA 2',3'-cyclic phosphodiesterase [Kangiella sediminilitoris]|uniref:RNA 2',3'-cyclic phosphodiesterase n=1 Tax=Kangiella sediminilitoris TaxID=1144748 RepID=A0A1B3BD84_9GAMM|nr:RNA 2',3'-cyclic phosphodiesterase [Kangiella sediminilitoris]AOE50750.1 hypothetical protein KS2013_2045 [Kangiella sediminilitoris]
MSSIANSGKNMARLFFAIDLPQHLKNKLELLQQTNPAFMGRAVNPHNFHITLQFLGSVAPDTVDEIIEAVSIPGIRPFSTSIERYAYYPKNEVGCVEVSQGNLKLKDLKNHISRCLADAGLHFAKDRHSFRPHVTLFRECQALSEIEQALDLSFTVDHFCLMQSHQNHKGVYYEVIEEWDTYEPTVKEQFFGIKD